MTDDYRRALEAAIAEYERLGEQRRAVDQRLAELSQTIGTLSTLLGLVPTVPLGLTDAIRLVVQGAGVPMTPVEIRNRLAAIGFDTSKYTNDLAAVHTILKRLNDSGELRFLARASGGHQYAWNHGVRTVIVPDIRRIARDNEMAREALDAREEQTARLSKRRKARRHPVARSTR